MAVENIVEQKETFEEGISKWQTMEDATIAVCEEIAGSTDNMLLKTIAGIIRADSEKHKMVLDVISQALDGTITLTPDELGTMSKLLDRHVELEQGSINMATSQLKQSRNFVVSHLLSYLLEDEKKHYLLLKQLDDFKKKLYPYA